MEKRVIFVPHYDESFKTLLPLALYMRDNKIGSPHFVLYFDRNMEVRKILQKYGIDFLIYKAGFLTKIPILGRGFKILADLAYSVRLVKRLSSIQAMVCTVESNEFEYALISVLNRVNINTIVLQWAQTAPNEYYGLRLEREGKKGLTAVVAEYLKDYLKRLVERLFGVKYSRLYGDGAAKYFAVMGRHYKEMFHKQGVYEDKLIVTGHPEHDRLSELSISVGNPGFKQAVLESFGLDVAKPLWIVAREAIAYFKLVPEEKDKQDVCNILEILSEYYPDVQIVLKLHPRDCEEYYDFVGENFPRIIIIHECDLYSLVSVCDLYISQISSTMMWAIALDKPVISYDFNNQCNWCYFRDREGIIKADSPEEFAGAVKTIAENRLSDEIRQQYQLARQKYMMFDGKVCQRIAELITRPN